MRRWVWSGGGIVGALLLAATALADPPGAAVTTVPTPAPGQALLWQQSPKTEASHVIKVAPGNLYAFGAASTASAGSILLLDATASPSTGAISSCGSTSSTTCVMWCAPIGDGSTVQTFTGFQLSPGPPMPFKNGIVAYFSTGGCTNANPGSAGIFFQWQVY